MNRTSEIQNFRCNRESYERNTSLPSAKIARREKRYTLENVTNITTIKTGLEMEDDFLEFHERDRKRENETE